MTSFNLQHRTSQSNTGKVNMVEFCKNEVKSCVFLENFIQLFAKSISNKNVFALFVILKYECTGYSGNTTFTVSLGANYDPRLEVGS